MVDLTERFGRGSHALRIRGVGRRQFQKEVFDISDMGNLGDPPFLTSSMVATAHLAALVLVTGRAALAMVVKH